MPNRPIIAEHRRRNAATSIALVMLAVGVCVAPSSTARAQGWLADRSRTEGPGIRLGDFELHPGIGVELGYDSNVFYTGEGVVSASGGLPARLDSGILRVTPHLLFSTIGQQRRTEGEGEAPTELPTVTFRGGVSGSYYEYFADETRRNFSLDAGLRLTVLPGRPFSFTVFDEFSRGIRPFVENTPRGPLDYSRDQNTAGLDLLFSTTGGVLQIRAGYRFGLDYFESDVFRYASSMAHTVELQQTFRFLPQTALVTDLSIQYRNYFLRGTSPPTLLNDSVTLTSRLGINGAITPEFSLLGMVGYSAGFFDSAAAGAPGGYDQDYDSVVVQAQASWTITQGTLLNLGYTRSFAPSLIGNYFSQDRGYATFQTMFAGSFLLGVQAGVGYVDFGQVVGPDGTMVGRTLDRNDVRVDASLFAEYRFTDWLGVNGSLGYQGDFTDFQYQVMVGSPMMTMTLLEPAGYNKFEAWLGVRVFY